MAGKRRRVAEGIYRLPSGRYQVTGYDPGRGGGSRPIPGRSTFDSLPEAREAKRDFEARKRARGGGRDESCDSFAERWTTEPGYRRPATTTNLHNAYQLKPFIRDFAGRPLREVSRPEARAWAVGGRVPPEVAQIAERWEGARRVRGGVEVPAHRGNVPAVRAMFTDALLDGLCDVNPFSGLRLEGSRGRKDIDPLTLGELELLTQMAHDVHGEFGPQFAAMIVVAAYTGMRPGEMYGLTWRDIDFEAGEIHVRRQLRSKTQELAPTKTYAQRTIVMPPEAAEALRGLPRLLGRDGAVFLTKRGRRYSGRIHHYYWNPVRVAFVAKLPVDHWLRQRIKHDPDGNLDFYELRHFCGSYLADRGATAADIALQLGHQDGGRLAQDLYIHTYKNNARDRLRAAFAGRPVAESKAQAS